MTADELVGEKLDIVESVRGCVRDALHQRRRVVTDRVAELARPYVGEDGLLAPPGRALLAAADA